MYKLENPQNFNSCRNSLDILNRFTYLTNKRDKGRLFRWGPLGEDFDSERHTHEQGDRLVHCWASCRRFPYRVVRRNLLEGGTPTL